jgi:hypothetical protein
MHVDSRGVDVAPSAASFLYSKFVNETERRVASGRQMSLRLHATWSSKYAVPEPGPDIMKTHTHHGGNTPCILNISTDIMLGIRVVQILWFFLKKKRPVFRCPEIRFGTPMSRDFPRHKTRLFHEAYGNLAFKRWGKTSTAGRPSAGHTRKKLVGHDE